MSALRDAHDALLLDLDGTVYRGAEIVPGALEALRDSPQRLLYVTNNASRSPSDVAAQLRDLGFGAADDDVVTSSQSAARLLGEQLPDGAEVVVVGTAALADEVAARGLRPVDTAGPDTAGVVQGHSPDTGWRLLAEACVAVRAGATWVAANTDTTLPTERGLLPGNGAMVAALRAATGVEPQVAGKPATPLLHDAVTRAGSERPLVVGDRLDTDIAGGRALGVPTLLVLTGVSTVEDLLRAPAPLRPDHVGADLRSLDRPADELAPGPRDGWDARLDGRDLVLSGGPDDPGTEDVLDAARAACPVAWGCDDLGELRAEGAAAEAVLSRWAAHRIG
ncbi:HAD-IIA family hydrolase [Rhodococcus aerolatus]